MSALRRRGRIPQKAWFEVGAGAEEAAGIAEVLDEVLRRIRAGKDEALRRQARARANADRRSAERSQLVLGTIAAIFLGPSLVASVFQALPGWQPLSDRPAAFAGLSLAAAGALWLIAYLLPAALARRSAGVLLVAGGVGVACVTGGLVIALPLRGGLDPQPPEITADCPTSTAQHARAFALVAASDPEQRLARDPSGRHDLRTDRVGTFTAVFRATDRFGQTASASCTYRVRSARSPSAPPADGPTSGSPRAK